MITYRSACLVTAFAIAWIAQGGVAEGTTGPLAGLRLLRGGERPSTVAGYFSASGSPGPLLVALRLPRVSAASPRPRGWMELSPAGDHGIAIAQVAPPEPGKEPEAQAPDATEPSLEELGFEEVEARGDEKQQQRLNKRSRMLKTHQILGLVTLAPMLGALALGEKAGEGSRADRNLHTIVGTTAAALYGATAYFAYRAPSVAGVKEKGLTRTHKILSYVHLPAMIAAPVLGYLAKQQADKGERAHGIAKYHSAAATTAAVTFTGAMLVIVFDF
ncbi:MAG: hypothetical protein HYV63_19110 [Candidatus Schekmanbacteria bacterium]|nr:hypothetical protein [Candidatus Schekmanbacteria bacterium]